MIEAAYVIPLMFVVMLAMLEVIFYSTDKLESNNVLTRMTDLVLDQARQEASLAGDQGLSYVACTGGKVTVKESTAGAGLYAMYAYALGDGENPPEGTIMNFTKSTIEGVDTYLVHVEIPSKTVFLPESMTFPITSKTIISFDLGC